MAKLSEQTVPLKTCSALSSTIGKPIGTNAFQQSSSPTTTPTRHPLASRLSSLTAANIPTLRLPSWPRHHRKFQPPRNFLRTGKNSLIKPRDLCKPPKTAKPSKLTSTAVMKLFKMVIKCSFQQPISTHQLRRITHT